MSGTAAAASSVFTVIRTSSLPAAASSAICSAVDSTSAVSVFVIDWTTIGCPLPTGTPSTRTVTVRLLASAAIAFRHFLDCMSQSRDIPRRSEPLREGGRDPGRPGDEPRDGRPVGGGTRRAREGYSTDPAVRAGVMVGRDGRWSVGTTAFPDAPFRKSGAGSGDGSRRRSTRVTLEDAASPAAPVLRGRILKQKLLLATLVIGSIVFADVSTK